MERINLEVAQMFSHNISGDRIQEVLVIRQLNGIRHVQGAEFGAFGICEDANLSEYNGILDLHGNQFISQGAVLT